jgi:hypothetical protein
MMPATAKYALIVSMDVEPEKEALFNEVYDTEHIPLIEKVPGVVSVTRFKAEPFAIKVGGEIQNIPLGGAPVYTAIYEIEDPAVLTSQAWAAAAEAGRWSTEVRPFTSNRQFSLKAKRQI